MCYTPPAPPSTPQCSGAAAPRVSPLPQSEYHYEYTACDSAGSRWRVAVPHTPGLCTGLPDPVRGTECCKAGMGGRSGGGGVEAALG